MNLVEYYGEKLREKSQELEKLVSGSSNDMHAAGRIKGIEDQMKHYKEMLSIVNVASEGRIATPKEAASEATPEQLAAAQKIIGNKDGGKK